MDPITDHGDRLPVPPFRRDPQPRPVDDSSSRLPPDVVYIPVYIEREAPEPPHTEPPARSGNRWYLIRLGFVGVVMAGAATLYALGHPAEAVLTVLVGSGLGAVNILKKLG